MADNNDKESSNSKKLKLPQIVKPESFETEKHFYTKVIK
jgi:hypothetical protein